MGHKVSRKQKCWLPFLKHFVADQEEILYGVEAIHNENPDSTLSAINIIKGSLLLLLVRQMEIPVSPMKVAVHRRSLRLPYSLRATGVWSGQIPFLSGS